MHAPHWLEQLRTELVSRKLPPRYVARFVLELSDHLNDSLEDPMSMDAFGLHDAVRPLGLPSEIAESAAAQYRQRSFSGRHPIVAFVAMPIVLLPLLWFGALMAWIGVGAGVAALGLGDMKFEVHDSPLARVATLLLLFGVVELPILLSTAFICRLASRAAVGWKWQMLACFVLAVVASMAVADVVMPTPDSKGRAFFGLGVSAHPQASQIVQFILPLAIGLAALTWQLKTRRRMLAS